MARRLLVVIALLGLGGAAAYVYWPDVASLGVRFGLGGDRPTAGQTGRRAPPAVPVTVARAERQTVPVSLSVIGAAQPYATVSVKSRVDGQILSVAFREGQTVRKGDPLFTIDPRPFQALLAQTEANLARDRAQLEKAKADVSRYTSLADKGYSSRQQYEQAAAAAAALEATIRAHEAAIAFAKLQLSYTDIRSPIDGQTGSVLINAGNLVKANETPAMVVINQVKPIYVAFSVPERELTRIRRRMARGDFEVAVTVPGDPGPPIRGIVTFVDNAVDTATGTIRLKATVANEDGRLTPGQFVDVRAIVDRLEQAVVVPAPSVQSGQRGAYVYVVKDDQAVEYRDVTLGLATEEIAVLEAGVQPGETVVVEGQLRLAPGTKVAARPARPVD